MYKKQCTFWDNNYLFSFWKKIKSRDITLPTKIPIAKARVFPVVMYGCESWTIKKGCVLKNWLIQKDLDSGKDWRWEEKGMSEDEMVGWHHQLDGHEFEQAPGVGDGQGCLVFCSPWYHKESDTTEWLNWTDEVLETYILE